MDNIRAMLQNYYGTEQTEEVKEEDYYTARCSTRTSTFLFSPLLFL